MAFALGEDGDQDISACHLIAARGLDVNHGPLNDPLETRRRLGVVAVLDNQGF